MTKGFLISLSSIFIFLAGMIEQGLSPDITAIIPRIVFYILMVGSAYWWHALDLQERQSPHASWVGILIMLIPPVGMASHMFRTRGFGMGAIASVVAYGVLYGFCLLYWAGQYLVYASMQS